MANELHTAGVRLVSALADVIDGYNQLPQATRDAIEQHDMSDDLESRVLWWAARVAGVWSGAGFALATTVAPDAINMGIGVGIFVPILTGMAIAVERLEAREAADRRRAERQRRERARWI